MIQRAVALIPSRKHDPADIMAASQRAHQLAQIDPSVKILQIGTLLDPDAYEVILVQGQVDPEKILWPT